MPTCFLFSFSWKLSHYSMVPVFEYKMCLYRPKKLFLLIYPGNLCLLIRESRPLIFKIISERCEQITVIVCISVICVFSFILYFSYYNFACFLSVFSWLCLYLCSVQSVVSSGHESVGLFVSGKLSFSFSSGM